MDTNRIPNKRYNVNQKDEETQDDRGRDEGTNFILRIKEEETSLIIQEHDDDDDDDDVEIWYIIRNYSEANSERGFYDEVSLCGQICWII